MDKWLSNVQIHPHLTEKACRAIFGLHFHIKESLAIKMFDKQIRPVLDYVCDFCYTCIEDYEMEKVHLGYLKYVLHIQPWSCTTAVFAKCERFPLIQALKYWKYLFESDDTITIRNAYNLLYESFTYGQVNWCICITNILDYTNNMEIWKTQCNSNSQIILKKYIAWKV